MSASSNPVLAWATNNPFAPLQDQPQETLQAPGSAAGSVHSVLSVGAQERRQRAEALYTAQMERLRVEMEDKLRMEDAASEQAKEEQSVKMEQPGASAKDAETEVMERELAELVQRQATLTRILAAKAGKTVLPPPPSSSSSSLSSSSDLRPLATTTSKIKVTAPEKWKGVYEYVEREAWIRTVEGYMASLGLDLQARIDRVLTPYPFFIIRSLFSSNTTHGGLSVVAWFDARDRRSSFSFVQQVLDALRAHWRDDSAADSALDAYRAAKQGSLRARDYGSRVETLADSVFDRSFDEADRMATFSRGLNSNYRDYLKMQVATLEPAGTAPKTLMDLVDVVAVADGLEAFSSSLKGRGGSSTSTTPSGGKRGAAGSDAPVEKKTGATPSSYEEKTNAWRVRAAEWQAKFPLASQGDWKGDGGQKPSQPLHCYLCGKLADHYSKSCPFPRKDPRSVTIAGIFASSPLLPFEDSPESEAGKAPEA